ncbi:Hus1-like protein [Tritrichomonas foetus]|uniref:Checkpoint protein n=1 Tax=Tritrichomonas foetus TaxID=1144522 RepID=A0A1J4KVF0_9EUKA|nr:Hus1-like protein [Tritrichomonas foetus]|eukprot:OHT13678.1 Hus1-like protein [Tritrichomonas foetus]
MRLNAEVTSDLLAKIAAILRSYSKDDIVLHFSENSLSFCIPMDNSLGIWAGCETNGCFNKYCVTSKQDNTISMKVEASQLAQALTMEHTSSIRIILSQTNNFVFLQFTHRSLDALKQLEHKVPVLIMTPQAVQHFAEPEWEPPTMMAKLPPIKSVSSWCANANNINKYLTISIIRNVDSGQYEVGFRVESDTHMVSVYTRFPEMSPPDNTSQSIEDTDLVECDVTVDLKKFIKILKVQALQPTVAILYIYDKKFIRLHFATSTSMLQMTYVLSGISH